MSLKMKWLMVTPLILTVSLVSPAPTDGFSPLRTPPMAPKVMTEVAVFSGEGTDYEDRYNGFKIRIPQEFELQEKGATTNWIGPIIEDGAAGIYINTVEMAGVPSEILYNSNLQAYQNNRNYTDVVPVTVKFGDETVFAFRCKEAKNKPGTADSKSADDIHRWHLFVFGNNRFYTLGFTGMFSAFESNTLPPVFEKVIESVELIPAS